MVWGLYVSHFCLTFVGSVLSGRLWGCVSLGMVQAIWSLETISELLMNTERMGSCWIVLLRFRSSPFLLCSHKCWQMMRGEPGVCSERVSGVTVKHLLQYRPLTESHASMRAGSMMETHTESLEVTLLPHKKWYHTTHIIKTSRKHEMHSYMQSIVKQVCMVWLQ